MLSDKPLNIFYEEPDPDRWFKLDRYPRKLIRRMVRGKKRPGGVMMIAINLMKGLDKIGFPYRFNDYSHIKKHPEEIACIIGKPHLLLERKWKNPVIFGAGIYSHPIEFPDLFAKYPNVKRFLVPGEWMVNMFKPFYADKVKPWPIGIDTTYWHPETDNKKVDFLIYDKIRWEYAKQKEHLIDPITNILDKHRLSYQFIKYGHYNHAELQEKLKKAKAVIFLCEHETQGIAYQQILSSNVPVLAWDREGYWQDPYYYPHKVKYQPVSSVPYWDARCGLKFADANHFEQKLTDFMSMMNDFKPRDYIVENLSLEKCAQLYLDIYNQVKKEIA